MVGESRCPISDTWWQTETGGFMVYFLSITNNFMVLFFNKPLDKNWLHGILVSFTFLME